MITEFNALELALLQDALEHYISEHEGAAGYSAAIMVRQELLNRIKAYYERCKRGQ